MAHKERVQWDGFVPGEVETGPTIRMLRVPVGDNVKCWLVSDYVVGVFTHWINGRTKACTGVSNGCEGCSIGKRRDKKGYLAVFTPVPERVWLLEITPKALDHEPRLYWANGLRGMLLTANKAGKSNTSALQVTLSEAKCPKNLPPEIDVQEILCRIWFGKEKSKKSQENQSVQ